MVKIKNILMVVVFILLCSSFALAAHTVVYVESNLGGFGVELFDDEAPITVKNFLRYADSRFYEQTIIHRVVPKFVIQGGGLTEDLQEKPTAPPIKNEAANGLKNLKGTLSMARTSDIDSATSQFFINLVDNPRLDHKDNTPAGFGYAVFGKVISGFQVVGKMMSVPTHDVPPYTNVPVTPIIIRSIKRTSVIQRRLR